MSDHLEAKAKAWLSEQHYSFDEADLRRLATLLREVEREALERAAAAVELIGRKYRREHDASSENVADECEAAIRALGAAPAQEAKKP